MNKSEQHKLNRLLSGGDELSVQEKETMLSRLLGDEGRPVEKRLFSPKGFFWVSSVAAAAAVALFAVYIGVSRSPGEENEELFTARGGAAGGFRIECLAKGGVSGPCIPGNKIAFGVLPPDRATYFSAAAVDGEGRLIRYFPTETEASLPLAEPDIQNRGIIIGAEHRPGRYRVFGIFSDSPLSVEQVKQVIDAYAEGRESGVEGIALVRENALTVVPR